MTDPGPALRSESDALLTDLELLEALEEEKRRLVPGEERSVQLASQVEELARRVIERSARQRMLTEHARDLAERASPAAPHTPIEAELPRELPVILAEWRDAERRAAAAVPDSLELAQAHADISRLREEYRRAHEVLRGS